MGEGGADKLAWLMPEAGCVPHSVQKACVPSEGGDNPKTVKKTPVHQKLAPKVLYEAPLPTHIFSSKYKCVSCMVEVPAEDISLKTTARAATGCQELGRETESQISLSVREIGA